MGILKQPNNFVEISDYSKVSQAISEGKKSAEL